MHLHGRRVFMPDGTPYDKAKKVKVYLKNVRVIMFEWTVKDPDLNLRKSVGLQTASQWHGHNERLPMNYGALWDLCSILS